MLVDAASLAREIQQTRSELLGRTAALDEHTLRQRPANAGWSVIEVLGHLVDVDRHWLQQALAIRDRSEHKFIPFDDEAWKRDHPAAQAAPLGDTLLALASSHEEVLRTLSGLSPEELESAGRHPRGHTYTVADVFRRFPAHDRTHDEQIAGIVAKVAG